MILPYIFTAAIMIISLLIQGHPSFDPIRVYGVKPDLVFIAVVYFGYSFNSFYGEVTGFIGGLFHDAVSDSPLGLLTLPKVIVGFLAGMLGRSVVRSNILTIFLLVGAATIVKGILTLLLAMVFDEGYVSDIMRIIIPETFYNAFLAPSLFFIYDKIFENELDNTGGGYY
ncbi:MAG: rod shape-determining protein MreD [Spirochaetes bacterium]|nr:rod shape-determining protein MreD [Spirochaetota bacterium]